MPLIDILSLFGDQCPYFTVNNAVDYVEIVTPTDPNPGILGTAYNKKMFTYKDNFNILSLGFTLPLSFELWQQDTGGTASLPVVYLFMQKISGGAWISFANPNALWLPSENYEMSLGVNVEFQSAINENFLLGVNFDLTNKLKISMFNVDASLNQKVFYVPVYMKILHTLAINLIP